MAAWVGEAILGHPRGGKMGTRDENRYKSRTYWLCWGIVLLAAALTWTGKMDGAGFGTVAIATLGAWQLRRYGDNKLLAENGG